MRIRVIRKDFLLIAFDQIKVVGKSQNWYVVNFLLSLISLVSPIYITNYVTSPVNWYYIWFNIFFQKALKSSIKV